MRSTSLRMSALAGALSVAVAVGLPSLARADSTSTAEIVAGVAALAGALIYDANNRPYYVRSGHRYYVTHQQATWYRQHHHGVERRAYVPEQEYPIARGRDHQGGDHGHQERHGR